VCRCGAARSTSAAGSFDTRRPTASFAILTETRDVEYASLGSRAAAFLIDFVISSVVTAMTVLPVILYVWLFGPVYRHIARLSVQVLSGVAFWLYLQDSRALGFRGLLESAGLDSWSRTSPASGCRRPCDPAPFRQGGLGGPSRPGFAMAAWTAGGLAGRGSHRPVQHAFEQLLPAVERCRHSCHRLRARAASLVVSRLANPRRPRTLACATKT
jgi:hypothetical protein